MPRSCSSTRPSVSTFSPPKVNLTCAVIGNPENGASAIGFAQFDFGGVIPEVSFAVHPGRVPVAGCRRPR